MRCLYQNVTQPAQLQDMAVLLCRMQPPDSFYVIITENIRNLPGIRNMLLAGKRFVTAHYPLKPRSNGGGCTFAPFAAAIR